MKNEKLLAKDTRIIVSIIIGFISLFLLWQFISPWLAEFYYRKGFVENTYRKFDESIISLDKAMKFAPWETYYLITQVRNYEELSRQKEDIRERVNYLMKAKYTYDRMIRINPTNPWYYSGLASIYLGLFNYSQNNKDRENYFKLAGEAYKTASSIDKLNPLFQMSLAFYYHRSGRIPEAEALYKKCVEYDSWFVEAYYNLAEIEMSRNNYDKALEYFEKMATADIENYDKNTGNYNQWVKDGNFNNYRAKMAEIYLVKKDFEKAIKYFKWAIDKNPDDARVWRGLGIAYHQSGQVDLAIYAYKQALSIDPDMGDVSKYLGYAYYNAGMLNSSMENLKQYSRNNLGDSKANDDLHKIGIIKSRVEQR